MLFYTCHSVVLNLSLNWKVFYINICCFCNSVDLNNPAYHKYMLIIILTYHLLTCPNFPLQMRDIMVRYVVFEVKINNTFRQIDPWFLLVFLSSVWYRLKVISHPLFTGNGVISFCPLGGVWGKSKLWILKVWHPFPISAQL